MSTAVARIWTTFGLMRPSRQGHCQYRQRLDGDGLAVGARQRHPKPADTNDYRGAAVCSRSTLDFYTPDETRYGSILAIRS